ncbi:MAG: tRNA pseudouridine(38-40) synthase TruA [Firmicutes bacterium]|nr:tRNA pseudouridine(38-40) synthase TruA [Bacillota bacterium]MBQ6841980.1 tRNA pseudouridine(38-40) synthase TruA [Bacillota bacterium]
MTVIKLTIQYDGTNYIGWQRQPRGQGVSVQQAIEDVLEQLYGEHITLHGAGRTDSGVHAVGQCASFVPTKPLPVSRVAQAMNNLLPPDIRISSAVAEAEDFHARFSASGKHYRYIIEQQPSCNAFSYRYAWQLGEKLDVAAMREAAQYLLGSHDFRHFCAVGSPVKDFVRTIESLQLSEPDFSANDQLWRQMERPLVIDICGNGFLYKMVRFIVGRLVAVGRHEIKPQDMAAFLIGEVPKNISVAPALGLTLVEVRYCGEKIGD